MSTSQAGQQAKAVEILVETGDLVDLRLEVFLAQPAGLGLASGMVGDGEVFVAQILRRLRHFAKRVFTVRGVGMSVQIALQVIPA